MPESTPPPQGPEHGVGFWVGLAVIIVGLVLILGFNEKDGLVLGGSGLVVAGALAAAISFEDASSR